ncbi:MAG: M23 family metallopeptidase, partial [Gammaproteobacteria bacterium]|nr:M23 family metallopeptidase [Gammaproteobacteria bacterium]NIR53086.1 M23 family metallopeptidase [candidate division KSB1 bacterium]NIV69344.1 peptidoglycan DD-metalloendopeptidase family protein [Phycisphaerae bacterium]NIQ11690.1 M23 family metallopeptidase [Gammaproteobacteria bacterium]NIU29061.1 M23 family metallopeptidase [candidate division KSB1 bacterium]
ANAPSISQGYKPEPKLRDPSTTINQKGMGVHDGIDILDESGTPVLAAADGVVESSSFGPLYGNQIVIAHGLNDDGLYYKTKYFHLQKRLVKEGDSVLRGQKVGTLGMTGLLSAGFAHLHFEVRTMQRPEQRLTQPVHPHKYWLDGPGLVTCFDKNREFPSTPFRTTYPVPCAGVRWKDWARDQ